MKDGSRFSFLGVAIPAAGFCVRIFSRTKYLKNDRRQASFREIELLLYSRVFRTQEGTDIEIGQVLQVFLRNELCKFAKIDSVIFGRMFRSTFFGRKKIQKIFNPLIHVLELTALRMKFRRRLLFWAVH